jgi:hypothetical protein
MVINSVGALRDRATDTTTTKKNNCFYIKTVTDYNSTEIFFIIFFYTFSNGFLSKNRY